MLNLRRIDNVFLGKKLGAKNLPSNFEPIATEFSEALLPLRANFEAQMQGATTLMTDHIDLKSEWVPDEPLTGNDDDESDDQICITLEKSSNADQGESRLTEHHYSLMNTE